MTGTVKDPSGGTVPRATVTVTNVGTNISVTTETDEMGLYTAPSLRAGEYSVTAESAGFSKVVRTGVILRVAQVARIDVTGAVSETVEVVGATSWLRDCPVARRSTSDSPRDKGGFRAKDVTSSRACDRASLTSGRSALRDSVRKGGSIRTCSSRDSRSPRAHP